jgi:hypothetical protein
MGLNGLWDAMLAVFSAADLIRLTLLVIILLLAGFLMPSISKIINATVVALAAFAGALYLRGLIAGDEDPVSLARTSWHSLLALDAKTLLAYALSFALTISLVFFLRIVIDRD